MPPIRPIHWKKFEEFLFSVGCEFIREKGDHRIYQKSGLKRPVIIPRNTQLPVFIIMNNLRTLGIGRDGYLNFLKQIKK